MSKIKLLIALVGAHLAGAACAQSTATPLTIQEWTLMQGELKRAEHANKMRDERKRGAEGPAPVVMDRTCDDDLQMSAVYGMGRNLRADFVYRGATVTLTPGGEADMGGWFVKDLTPTRALMVKRVKGAKTVKTCPLYLSAGARDYTVPVVPVVSASGIQAQVPPISPVASAGANIGTQAAALGGAK